MLNNRLAAILAAVAMVIVAAAFVINTGTPTNHVVPQEVRAAPDRGLPSGEIRLENAEASDYYQRHPGLTIAIEEVSSDWYARHPELMNAGNTLGASDYFERHPEVFRMSDTADLSDWYQRHRSSLTR